MTKIPGTPEGRPGVWRITPATAGVLLLSAATENGTIHNQLGTGAFLCGANWTRANVLAFLAEPARRWALIFPPQVTVGHQLVAINDANRWAFDVGPIAEDRMQDELAV